MAQTSDKQSIRNRYRGISQDELETIPAIEKADIFTDESDKTVGVYARVSTGDPRQTSSFELQQNHYTDLIERRPGWHLYKIYADEGISGTSLKHREAFKQMIADCREHKVDLIITKSVSRFARNIYDCIGYVRELAALKPPIGVLFETENLYTLNGDSEMALSFIATLAQEESHNKSSSMNLSYEMRFSRGIFMTPELLGYDKDEEGNLVINEDEALTVRLIFFMFLYGYEPSKIAETLMQLKRKTKRGLEKWTAGTVMGILQNERHCGDVLAHKTVTPNYLDHKSVPNRGERAQYRQKDHHEGIISRDDFLAAQRIISFGMKGRGELLPRIHVIDNGALKGFAILNPRWAGFTADDYMQAVNAVVPAFSEEISAMESAVRVAAGTVDLRGFEVVRGQFFENGRLATVTFGAEHLVFSAGSLRRLDQTREVELLFDPIRKFLVARPARKGNRNAVSWSYFDGRSSHPKKIVGRAFLPVIYEMMKWNMEWPYSAAGECRNNGEDSFLLFDLNDAEAMIKRGRRSNDTEDEGAAAKDPAAVTAIPGKWLESFGDDYYHADSLIKEKIPKSKWNTTDPGTPGPDTSNLTTTSKEELETGIQGILEEMRRKGTSNG